MRNYNFYIYVDSIIKVGIITVEGSVNKCCLIHLIEYLNSNTKVINGVAKVGNTTIRLPYSFGGEGMTLHEVSLHYINNFTIEKTLEDCINDGKSFKPILDICNLMNNKYKWLTISYALHLIRDTNHMTEQCKKDILPLLYDERVVSLEADDILEELILKKNISYLNKIIHRQINSREVIRYFLYKFLHRTFPDDMNYWLKYKQYRKIDKSRYIEKVQDWDDIFIELGVTKELIISLINSKEDLSDYKNLNEYIQRR